MDPQSLAGLPAFLLYYGVAAVLIAAYIFIYTWITPHDEFALIRSNVPGAAVSLGLSTVGFALPLTSAISHSSGILDLTIWGVVALIVQIVPGAHSAARPVQAHCRRRNGPGGLARPCIRHRRADQRRLDEHVSAQ